MPLGASTLEVLGDDAEGALVLAVFPLPESDVVAGEGVQHMSVTLEGARRWSSTSPWPRGTRARRGRLLSGWPMRNLRWERRQEPSPRRSRPSRQRHAPEPSMTEVLGRPISRRPDDRGMLSSACWRRARWRGRTDPLACGLRRPRGFQQPVTLRSFQLVVTRRFDMPRAQTHGTRLPTGLTV
jgi:hypothetical protein